MAFRKIRKTKKIFLFFLILCLLCKVFYFDMNIDFDANLSEASFEKAEEKIGVFSNTICYKRNGLIHQKEIEGRKWTDFAFNTEKFAFDDQNKYFLNWDNELVILTKNNKSKHKILNVSDFMIYGGKIVAIVDDELILFDNKGNVLKEIGKGIYSFSPYQESTFLYRSEEKLVAYDIVNCEEHPITIDTNHSLIKLSVKIGDFISDGKYIVFYDGLFRGSDIVICEVSTGNTYKIFGEYPGNYNIRIRINDGILCVSFREVDIKGWPIKDGCVPGTFVYDIQNKTTQKISDEFIEDFTFIGKDIVAEKDNKLVQLYKG